MSKKQEWRDAMMAKFEERYQNISALEKQTIEQSLNLHWELCKEKSDHAFKRLPAILFAASASYTNLSAILPSAVIPIVLGRASYMALKYFVGDYISRGMLSEIIPVLYKLEQEHLAGLFKKADDVAVLIQQLNYINGDIADAISKDEKATLMNTAGFFAGEVLTGVIMGPNAVKLATRGRVGIAAVLSYVAPKLFFGREHGIGGMKTHWQKQLRLAEAEDEGEANNNIANKVKQA